MSVKSEIVVDDWEGIDDTEVSISPSTYILYKSFFFFFFLWQNVKTREAQPVRICKKKKN